MEGVFEKESVTKIMEAAALQHHPRAGFSLLASFVALRSRRGSRVCYALKPGYKLYKFEASQFEAAQSRRPTATSNLFESFHGVLNLVPIIEGLTFYKAPSTVQTVLTPKPSVNMWHVFEKWTAKCFWNDAKSKSTSCSTTQKAQYSTTQDKTTKDDPTNDTTWHGLHCLHCVVLYNIFFFEVTISVDHRMETSELEIGISDTGRLEESLSCCWIFRIFTCFLSQDKKQRKRI